MKRTRLGEAVGDALADARGVGRQLDGRETRAQRVARLRRRRIAAEGGHEVNEMPGIAGRVPYEPDQDGQTGEP